MVIRSVFDTVPFAAPWLKGSMVDLGTLDATCLLIRILDVDLQYNSCFLHDIRELDIEVEHDHIERHALELSLHCVT